MQLLGEGHVSKMAVYPDEPVRYELRLDDQYIPLNPHIGSPISIRFLGEIHCLHCQRRTKKSYSQGYCYPCFKIGRAHV